MSAPDTNAFVPAPVSTTTRSESSVLNSSMMRPVAAHMSSDIALWRSGLLNTMYPTPPSLRESTLSVLTISFMSVSLCCLEGLLGAQLADLVLAEPELGQHLVGVLAEVRRRRHDVARRARERDRLTHEVDHLLLLIAHAACDAEMLHLRIAERLVDRVDRPARHAGLVQRVDPFGAGALHG